MITLDYYNANSVIDGGAGTNTVKVLSTYAVADAVIAIATDFDSITGLDASDLTVNVTITGTLGDDSIIGGTGNDSIYGDAGNDTIVGNNQLNDADSLYGGAGDDLISLSYHTASSVIDGGTGTNTVAVNDSYAGSDTSISISDFTNINNLDASAVTDGYNLALTGDANANLLTGGAGADTIDGGTGTDEYYFYEGDALDTITAAEASELLVVDTSTGIDTSDILFYTDGSSHLYMDYTDASTGSDVVEMLSSDNTATIQVGSSTITVSQILTDISGYYTNLTASDIAGLDYGDKQAEVGMLTWTT